MCVRSIPGKKIVLYKKHKMGRLHHNRVMSVVGSLFFAKIIIIDLKNGVILSMDMQR
jgi:hypothetical protein